MPTSAKTFDKEVEELLSRYINKGMRRFLDIGAGGGKYGRMLSMLDYVSDENIPDFYTEAVESEGEYVEQYNLKDKYDFVYHSITIQDFIIANPNYCTNVVILGDILEHLKKSDGIDVLEFFIYRCNYIIVIVPQKLIQFDSDKPQECHNSIWKDDDFREYQAKCIHKNGKILVTIPGYFNHPDARISKASYKIMVNNGCDRFRGTIMDQ